MKRGSLILPIKCSLVQISSSNTPFCYGLFTSSKILCVSNLCKDFTRRLCGMSLLSYASRLKALGLETSERRHLQHDLSSVHTTRVHGPCVTARELNTAVNTVVF